MNGLRTALDGDTGPTWVALHGYPDTLRVFEPLAAALRPHARLVRFDWPGQGRSVAEAADPPRDPWARARFLAALLDELELPRTSLVAHDMGVLPALAFARLFPARVERLVLAHALLDDRGPVSLDITLLRGAHLYPFVLAHAPGLVFDRCMATFLPEVHALAPAGVAEMRDDFVRTRDAVIEVCRAYDAALPSFLAELGDLAGVPVDLVWSTAPDLHFPVAHAEALARRVQSARIHRMAEGRHWMLAGDAPTFAKIVEIMRFGA